MSKSFFINPIRRIVYNNPSISSLENVVKHPKNVLILDRDGTLTVNDPEYLHETEKCKFTDGACEALKKLQEKDFIIIFNTSQSGIARGYFLEEQFHVFMDWIVDYLYKHGVESVAVYYCPHHPEKGIGEYKIDCECRKPKPGMILQAFLDFNINPEKDNVWLIGDGNRDVESARLASEKIKTIQTETQGIKGSDEEEKVKPDFKAKDLAEAIEIILKGRQQRR